MESDPVPRSPLESAVRAAANLVPFAGESFVMLLDDARARRLARITDVLRPIEAAIPDADRLSRRLAADVQLDVLFNRAILAAADSGLDSKRIALGRVVAAALTDSASLDRSLLLVDALAQVDSPHVRALAEIQAVVRRVGRPIRAQRAGYQLVHEIIDVGNRQDTAVLSRLKSLGLLVADEASASEWYVHELTRLGTELLSFIQEPSAD